MFQPALESMPLTELRALQSQRLHLLVNRLYEKVPFYQQKFDEENVRPAEIKHISDLSKLPFTYKDDLRQHYPFGLFTMPVSDLARIHCSSGTTGKPTVVGYSPRDLEIFAEVNARSLAAAGARPGMMLHNAYGYGLFTGGLGLHAGAERLGMTVVPVSGGMTDRQIMLLQDFGPQVICCTPSYAQTLADELYKRSIDPASLNLSFAVLGAEPWTETIRQQVEAGLQVQATNIYGLSEIIGPGVSQEAVEERGTGSYVWEDHFYPEVVDPDTGEVLPEGQDGVLVITTLTKEAFPVLRYWTNDICSLHYDPHAKRTHIKMSAIKGRADDMLIIRGVNLFHTQVEELLPQIPELSPFYQLIVRRSRNLDSVEVKVEVQEGIPNKEEYGQALAHKIKQNIGLNMQVSLLSYGEIPRSEGGKLKRIVDLRK
ncbi:MAG: AMP-binding protein [Bacteroidota bacterium]